MEKHRHAGGKALFPKAEQCLVILVGFAVCGGPASAAQETAASVAMTIYSTAQPGAIPPDLYRPAPQPGGRANLRGCPREQY